MPDAVAEFCDATAHNDVDRIKLIRPHLRPWLATTVFAALLGPKIARHPGVIRRALSR